MEQKKQDQIRLAIFILMVTMVLVSCFTLYKVLTNIELLSREPVSYFLDYYGYDFCSCFLKEGGMAQVTPEQTVITRF